MCGGLPRRLIGGARGDSALPLLRLGQAQRECEEAMQDLKRCRDTGNWFTRFESLRLVDRL